MEGTWTCHICGKTRPDACISVCTKPLKIGEVIAQQNVRYCNDNPECERKARTEFSFIKTQPSDFRCQIRSGKMDTTLRECIICDNEGDCIEGICSQCAANRSEAEECVWREFCPDCKGYGHEGEGCIREKCETFQKEVKKTLKDWSEQF